MPIKAIFVEYEHIEHIEHTPKQTPKLVDGMVLADCNGGDRIKVVTKDPNGYWDIYDSLGNSRSGMNEQTALHHVSSALAGGYHIVYNPEPAAKNTEDTEDTEDTEIKLEHWSTWKNEKGEFALLEVAEATQCKLVMPEPWRVNAQFRSYDDMKVFLKTNGWHRVYGEWSICDELDQNELDEVEKLCTKLGI